jgi:hypothetical protein
VLSAGDRVASLPVAALMCRDLRHAWPRTTRDIARLVEWEATVVGAGGRIVEGVRRMYCTGGCGVRRVEKVRRDRQGRLVREGKASLQYPKDGYLLGRPEPGVEAEPVDADTIRDAVMRQMFPDLVW